MFFEYTQNNSGGAFIGPVNVLIEADNPEEANQIAVERTNIYFGGRGDCSCCGDRWSDAGDYNGSKFPARYGEPLEKNYTKRENITLENFLKLWYANGSTPLNQTTWTVYVLTKSETVDVWEKNENKKGDRWS